MQYVPKVGQIYVTTLTNSGTWYEVLTAAQARGIRGFKIKSRYTHGATTQRPFDYAFSSSPGDNYWSNSGSGSGDEAGPVSGIWARSAVSGCIIEVMTYD